MRPGSVPPRSLYEAFPAAEARRSVHLVGNWLREPQLPAACCGGLGPTRWARAGRSSRRGGHWVHEIKHDGYPLICAGTAPRRAARNIIMDSVHAFGMISGRPSDCRNH
jgi:hypothetical protein